MAALIYCINFAATGEQEEQEVFVDFVLKTGEQEEQEYMGQWREDKTSCFSCSPV